MKRALKSRKSRLESLEQRRLMAGDVLAVLEGSLLTIEGDNLDNQIVMTRNVTGAIVITGQDGTLVNGLTSMRFPAAQLNAVEVRMGDGNDALTLRGLVIANDINVNLGAGNDRLTSQAAAASTINGSMSVMGEGGNDVIQLAGITVREDLNIDGGTGTLNATINAANVDKVMSIISDEADDIISIVGSRVGLNVMIETKAGSDRVTLIDFERLRVGN